MKIAAVLFASAVAFTTYSLYASAATGLPAGWSLEGEAPQLYRAKVDRADSPSGQGSVVLQRTETGHPYGSAWLLKTLPAEYAGKRIRVSYHLLAQDVEGPNAGIVFKDSHGQHTQNSLASGRWTWYRKLVTLPAATSGQATGIALKGPGTVKIDTINIEVLGDAPAGQGTRQMVSFQDADK